LKKADFVLSTKRKLVTVKKSEAGRKSGTFALATARAYKRLGCTGFIPVKKGTNLYKAALEEMALMTAGA
jgi:DNA-binding transcriptional regulator YhcF (GntR family)